MISLTFVLLLSHLSVILSYTYEALKDQIKSMPNSLEDLKSNQFSGYLQISETKYIHYIYYESENNPKKDNLVFWTNGGPGCSGLLGLFTEMGPWRPVENGSLSRNPHTWTQYASFVFLEQPAGVGFSFSTDPDVLYNFNDEKASTDNILTIKAFFDKFPERKQNKFFVASESYGGHYIPQITHRILSKSENSDLRKQFAGFIVGNPYTSFASGSIAGINVMWGLQLLPYPAWDLITKSTCDSLSQNLYTYSQLKPQCLEYLDVIWEMIDALNPYALDFPVCPLGSALLNKPFHNMHGSQARVLFKKVKSITRNFMVNRDERHKDSIRKYLSAKPFNIETLKSTKITPESNIRDVRAMQYDPCSEIYTTNYLNLPDVQNALNVGESSIRGKSNITAPWNMCNDIVNGYWLMTDFIANTTHLYSDIFNHVNKPSNFKMLVFSGDSDGVCATVGTQDWIYKIRNSKILSLFEPWYYEDSNFGKQPGGFLTRFNKNLAFLTVHYAGHEVPAYQPEKALEVFKRYLDGSLFTSSTESDSESTATQASDKNSSLFVVLAILLVITAIIILVIVNSPKKKDFELLGNESSHSPIKNEENDNQNQNQDRRNSGN